jgi:hypothetical protein
LRIVVKSKANATHQKKDGIDLKDRWFEFHFRYPESVIINCLSQLAVVCNYGLNFQ